MTDRSTVASVLVVAGLFAHSARALADDAPPAPAAAAPEVAPAAAADDDSAPASRAATAPDSDASPAAPAPNTSPAVILQARELTPAPPAPERPDPHADDGKMGSHQSHFLVNLGYRVSFVGNRGLDAFSDDDAVPQVSLSAGRTLVASGNWSLAALALWDWGQLESTARGAKSTLTVNRITLGAEGRYHLFRRLYVFGRLAPGALQSSAALVDNVTQVNQTSSAWVFAGDLSAGTAFEFAGENRGESLRPRGWIGFDGGYGFATSSQLTFKPEQPAESPVRTQPQAFGELAVRGGFLRLTVTGTY
jgi:hypothetical protein